MKAMTKAVGAGTLSGVIAGAVLFFSVTLTIGFETIPVAAAIAAGLVAFAVVSAAFLRGRLGAGVAGGMAAAAPVVTLGCLASLSDPVVSSHWQCGTGLIGIYLVGAVLFVAAPALGAVVMGLGASPWRRIAGAVVTAGGLALLVILVPQGLTRMHAPEPQAWVATLPIVGTLPPAPAGEGAAFCGEANEYRPETTCDAGYACVASRCQSQDEVKVAGTTFYRSCSPAGHCLISLAEDDDGATGFGEPMEIHSAAALPVRYDADHDLWVVGGEYNRVAFAGQTGEVVDVDVRQIADSLSPPRGWVLAGAGGLGAAALALLFAAIAWGRARRIARARSGQVDAYGGIAFADGCIPCRGLPATPLAEGPVLAIPRGKYHGPSYRTVEGPVFWDTVPGDRASVTERYEAKVDAWLNVALSAAWLTAAPLAAASFAGLIG